MGNSISQCTALDDSPRHASAKPSTLNSNHVPMQSNTDYSDVGVWPIHYVHSSNRLIPPFKNGLQSCVFAAGCFWGTEKGFWRLPGVYSTAVGYIGGRTANPTYSGVCSGATGHAEATLVVFDPTKISLADLLRRFFDCHDPTQGNRQGNDRGTQYRSGIYTADEEQAQAARACLAAYDAVLRRAGYRPITTEVQVRSEFWYAEDYHQQYLAKPGARKYCSAEPTGQQVPAITGWGLPAHLAAKFAPLLPDAFWAVYDGSIHAPNSPAKLDGRALAQAREMRRQLQEDAASAEAALRDDESLDGLVRYCGGCGFRLRAEQLADHLQAVASVRLGLVQDVGITGNFDVEVRRAGGGFSRVHSKAGRGDGFVDTPEKMEAILSAIGKARAEADPWFVQRVWTAALRFEPIERAAAEAAEAAKEAAKEAVAAEAPKDEAVLRAAQAKYPNCLISSSSLAHAGSPPPSFLEAAAATRSLPLQCSRSGVVALTRTLRSTRLHASYLTTSSMSSAPASACLAFVQRPDAPR